MKSCAYCNARVNDWVAITLRVEQEGVPSSEYKQYYYCSYDHLRLWFFQKDEETKILKLNILET